MNTSQNRLSQLRPSIQSSPHHVVLTPDRSKWRQILNHAYPLPEAPPEKCRDAFLEDLLKSYVTSSSSSSDDSIMSTQVKFHRVTVTQIMDSFNTEENLLNVRRVWDAQRRSTSIRESLLTESSLYAPDLNKLMKERYGNIASAIGFMAVIFNLNELSDRMRIERKMWSMNLSIDRELRLFGWSIKDYLARFTRPNLVYLDTAERLLGKQIECFKFHVDLKEINRLIESILDDLRTKRDLCQGSLNLIKDAEIDIEQLLTKSQAEATEEHAKVTTAALHTPRSADPFGRRAKAIYEKINHNDFVYPIEARYHINWVQAQMEQSILKDQLNKQHSIDELNELKHKIDEVGRLWHISNIAYSMQINELKKAILNREMLYEDRLLSAELEIQATRQRLGKVKDDLSFYKDQIPMFQRKIVEVREILARQEEASKKSLRFSRKSSRHSSKAKLELKK